MKKKNYFDKLGFFLKMMDDIIDTAGLFEGDEEMLSFVLRK